MTGCGEDSVVAGPYWVADADYLSESGMISGSCDCSSLEYGVTVKA